MSALIDLSWNSEYGLYIWTGILIAVILGIAFPVTIYEQKIVKRRWQAVTEFLEQHQGQVAFRPHHMKQQGDILVPVFSGFLIHGHFAYICLDPAQDRQAALSFITRLREFCLAHNSWHFDYFTSRFYAWLYYKRARRAFGDAYHALQRTRRERRGCNRTPSWAGSLSLGRSVFQRTQLILLRLL